MWMKNLLGPIIYNNSRCNWHVVYSINYVNILQRKPYACFITMRNLRWGTACKSRLQEISIRLNNSVRIISWNNEFAHVTKLYKKLKILKLNKIYQVELAQFMQQLNYYRSLDVYCDQFTKIE